MTLDLTETREWSQAHKAAWELLPLVEMQGPLRVQVGFQLELYARIPGSLTADTDVAPLWDRLRELAECLAAQAPAGSRLEVEPFDAAGRLRPETGFAPEVLLHARVFHAADYFEPVTDDDRRQLKPIEDRLREMGLRERGW